MKINLNDLPKIAHVYVRQQVLPKVPSSPLQFLLGLGNNYIANVAVENILKSGLVKYYEMLRAIGIIDENNQIDIEKLYENSINAIDDCTGHSFSFNITNDKRYTMNKDDIAELFNIAKRYVVDVQPQTPLQNPTPL